MRYFEALPDVGTNYDLIDLSDVRTALQDGQLVIFAPADRVASQIDR